MAGEQQQQQQQQQTPLSTGPALSGQQLVDDLAGRLERLGGVRETGQFSLDMDVYTPVQQQQHQQAPSSQQQQQQPRTLHVVASSEAPVSSYIVPSLTSSASASASVVETLAGPLVSADSMFGLLLSQLRSVYQVKPGQAVHCRGPKYRLDDFTVRLATAVFGQSHSVKGVFVEVEYRPCSRLQLGWPLLKEFFVNAFPERAYLVEQPNEALQAHLQAQPQPTDYAYPVTVLQYLLLAYQLGSSRHHHHQQLRPAANSSTESPMQPMQQQAWGRAPLPGPPGQQLIGR